jgi:hypothetical protein
MFPVSEDDTKEIRPQEGDVSAYLLTEPRILREACQAMGGDDGGRRCPQCCVREFCESQAWRAGKFP